jgi:hypothetical protein
MRKKGVFVFEHSVWPTNAGYTGTWRAMFSLVKRRNMLHLWPGLGSLEYNIYGASLPYRLRISSVQWPDTVYENGTMMGI